MSNIVTRKFDEAEHLTADTTLLQFVRLGGIIHYSDFTITKHPHNPAWLIMHQLGMDRQYQNTRDGLEAALQSAQQVSR